MGCQNTKQIETTEKSVPEKDGEGKKIEEANGEKVQETTAANETTANSAEVVESKATEQTTASDDVIVTDT